jgi:hypothetical protein
MPKDAEARLTDLDVREVSVVDRPANKRRFLIVKRDNGGLAVIRTEEAMPRTAIPRDAAEEFGHILESDDEPVGILKDEDIADLFDATGEPDDAEDADAGAEEKPELEAIEKGMAAEAAKIAKAAVQRLMSVANKLKAQKEGSAKLAPPLANDVRTVAKALAALAEKISGKGDKGKAPAEGTEKAAKDALAVVTAALEKLMSTASKLQALEADADVPPAIAGDLRAIATALTALVSAAPAEEEMGGGKKGKGKPAPEEEPTAKSLAKPEVFIAKADSDDPEIIIKAGRKMKRTRFSLFKKAVEMLQEVLRELEETQSAPAGKKPSKAEKSDEDFQQKMLDKLDGIKEEVGKVNKRVDELETARPTGTDDDPPKPVEKRQSMWGNVLGLK